MTTKAPFVRGSATSKAAADSLSESLGKLEQQVFECIQKAGSSGRTDDEIEIETGLSHQTASARRRGLVQKNRICNSGLIRATRSKRKAIVWVVGKEKYILAGAPLDKAPPRPSTAELEEVVKEIKKLVELGKRGMSPKLHKLLQWLSHLLYA